MTFQVYERGLFSRRELASFTDFDAAEAFVQALNPVCYEVDADYPGCADAFLASGVLVHIEAI